MTKSLLEFLAPILPTDTEGNERKDIWDVHISAPLSVEDKAEITVTVRYGVTGATGEVFTVTFPFSPAFATSHEWTRE